MLFRWILYKTSKRTLVLSQFYQVPYNIINVFKAIIYFNIFKVYEFIHNCLFMYCVMSTLYFLMLLPSSPTGLIDLLLLSQSCSSMSSSFPPVCITLVIFDFWDYIPLAWICEFDTIDDDMSAFDFFSPGFSILLW